MATQPLGQRRRNDTQDIVANAAIELFTTVGFEETSMEAIAEACGVSRRTIYRHFATKADLVFKHPHRWLAHFETVLDSAEGSARELVERGITEVAEIVAADPDPVLAAFAVRMANPELGATHAKVDALWVELIFNKLFIEHGPDKTLDCMVCAGALIGATNALFVAWSFSYPDADLAAMTAATLEQCDGLWP